MCRQKLVKGLYKRFTFAHRVASTIIVHSDHVTPLLSHCGDVVIGTTMKGGLVCDLTCKDQSGPASSVCVTNEMHGLSV